MFLWGQPATTDRDLKIASSANFHWQKTLFQWRDIEGTAKGVFDWTESDRVVKASTANGIKIIARIDFQPDWARKDLAKNGPPDNYQDYADFISAFATRYRPARHSARSTPSRSGTKSTSIASGATRPSTASRPPTTSASSGLAYNAAHAAQPNIVVITAGLSPTGVKTSDAWDDAEYMQWLFDAGLKGGVNYDVLGAHGNTQAPEVEVAQLAAGLRRRQLLLPSRRAVAGDPGQSRRCRPPDLVPRVRLDGRQGSPRLRLVLRHRRQEGRKHRQGLRVRPSSTGRPGSAS